MQLLKRPIHRALCDMSLIALHLGFRTTPLQAQTATVNIARAEEAWLKAAREAAERAQREALSEFHLEIAAPSVLGAFRQEAPCFPLRQMEVRGTEHRKLHWISPFVGRHIGKCVGAGGLDYMLRELQTVFLNRGFGITRAGFAGQAISEGSLKVDLIGGTVGVANGRDNAALWQWAAPSNIVTDLSSTTASSSQSSFANIRLAGTHTTPNGLKSANAGFASMAQAADAQDTTRKAFQIHGHRSPRL